MVIGVSVEEATVDSTHPHHHDRRSTAFASPETAKSRPRASTLTIPVSNSPNSNWMSKAKEFTQRIRRKSNIGLPTEQP
ncbi:hypothetical protein SERLA73DRAFT_190628 [Serpula lacrymans var. lacrymans S7.3]|uniref:Uncharacterized protein n=2 Tax=Serpula lacrymans var. lacrymans TaxID=341189 RepID=F8QG25_SERL3|nr:uncharacterized protein SERLADRAFT_463502 [Serpula lacrymans var. lacrymans S7.9]EGN92773.1 hypothetical protein SERLA73DRAFT_190628 [Serpula lacrymans var. lacrymans S7.3]EGO26434.1 hypothetical protein SERLADRAFT_463502 [Serpula lacrymans var. lacrymans S7.9]